MRDRIRLVAKAGAATAALIGTLCVLIGISVYGWIASMQNSGKTMGTLSVSTRVGYVVSSICRTIGLPSNDHTWIALFRYGGLLLAAYLCVRLLGWSTRIGAVQAAAISMLAVVLLGPVVWPWYLAPAIALLGAAGVGRWRPALLVLTISFAFEVFPVGPKSKPVLEGSHVVSLLLILLIGVLTVAAPFAFEWWRGQRGDDPPDGELLGFASAD